MAERKRKPKPTPEMEQLAQAVIAAMASQPDGYRASDVYDTMQEGKPHPTVEMEHPRRLFGVNTGR